MCSRWAAPLRDSRQNRWPQLEGRKNTSAVKPDNLWLRSIMSEVLFSHVLDVYFELDLIDIKRALPCVKLLQYYLMACSSWTLEIWCYKHRSVVLLPRLNMTSLISHKVIVYCAYFLKWLYSTLRTWQQLKRFLSLNLFCSSGFNIRAGGGGVGG